MSGGYYKRPSRLGRKGDPRMHKAVAARVANPSITLLQALRDGGFNFTAEGGDDSTLVDSDSVTLGQRKNQLSRRLRLSKHSGDLEDVDPDSQQNAISTQVPCSVQTSLRSLPQKNPQRASFKRGNSGLSISDYEIETTAIEGNEDASLKIAKFQMQSIPTFTGVRSPAPASTLPVSRIFNSSRYPSVADAAQKQFISQQDICGSRDAVASLSSTAAGIGMSLEQLALSLSSTPNLMRVLLSRSDSVAREELALNMFQAESLAILQKCMLLAGYEGSEAIDGSETNIRLAIKSWELEGARLEKLVSHTDTSLELSSRQESLSTRKMVDSEPWNESIPQHSRMIPPSKTAHSVTHSPIHKHTQSHTESLQESLRSVRSKNSKHRHEQHDHGDDKSNVVQDHSDEERNIVCFHGQHVHSLSGKCGHKPVIHIPEGGEPHIDFVVDGAIECYEGVKHVGSGDGHSFFWPSRFKCADIGEATDASNPIDCNHCTKGHRDYDRDFEGPKELPLSDVNLDGKEWNLDFFNETGQDDTILGLFRLGGKAET